MEVKDVTNTPAFDAASLQNTDKALDTTSKAPQVEKTNTQKLVPDEVELSISPQNTEASEVNESRLNANVIISRVNLAIEGTEKIGKILKSISGIVEQAVDAPKNVRDKFSEEATDLAKAISQIAKASTPSESPSVTHDKFRAEVENTIGKTLDIIFPGNAKTSYGLDSIELSTKETIISTRSNVAKAVAQYEELRKSVAKSAEEVKALSQSLDVIATTKQSLQPLVRRVDDAIKLTGGTRISISAEPLTAIASIGNVSAQVLQ